MNGQEGRDNAGGGVRGSETDQRANNMGGTAASGAGGGGVGVGQPSGGTLDEEQVGAPAAAEPTAPGSSDGLLADAVGAASGAALAGGGDPDGTPS